jgi:OmpA-OmpF porin, OOP family
MHSRTHRNLVLAAWLAGSAAALPALAEGLYVGGAVGKPDLKGGSIAGQSTDSRGAAFKLYGGYKFNDNIALEAGGVNLGKFGTDGRVRGAFLDAVGTFPLSPNWAALGRVGVARTKTKAAGASDTTTAPKVGLGVQYNLSQRTSVRGEWERYRVPDFSGRTSADMVSVGVNFGF